MSVPWTTAHPDALRFRVGDGRSCPREVGAGRNRSGGALDGRARGLAGALRLVGRLGAWVEVRVRGLRIPRLWRRVLGQVLDSLLPGHQARAAEARPEPREGDAPPDDLCL